MYTGNISLNLDNRNNLLSNFSNIIENITASINDELIDELFRLEQEDESNLNPATEEEISSIQKVKFNSEENELDLKCSICQDKFIDGDEYGEMPCSLSSSEISHIFHHDCLTTWLKRDNTCPICRKSIHLEKNEKIIIFSEFPDRSLLIKSFYENTILRDFVSTMYAKSFLPINLNNCLLKLRNTQNGEVKPFTSNLENHTLKSLGISNGSHFKFHLC